MDANIQKEIEQYQQDSYEFTVRAENYLYDTVDLKNFRDKEADFIYDCLKNNLRTIPFSDYLKRYISQKAGMTGDYAEIDIREYQEIIVESFRENRTPASFSETTARVSSLAKNWLAQESVKRQVIFLLGFGLHMSVDDVSSFLVKAQKERDFNFKDPLEIIYWYCFKNGYKFAKMSNLKEAFELLPHSKNSSIYNEQTLFVRGRFQLADSDEQLLAYIADFKTDSKNIAYSVTSYKWFCDLYAKTKEIIAGYYNSDETDNLEKQIQKYLDEVHNSSRLSDLDKRKHTDEMRKSQKVWTASEITDGDVERILCCGTPIDESGNLMKFSDSALSVRFVNKRMNRQHIGEVLDKNIPVDRFDLITLNFFVFSQDGSYENNQRRFNDFIDATNRILDECSMGELYAANPYECFLLMCVVSDSPFTTYSEVLEKSFYES
jgi:hypothetical protein